MYILTCNFDYMRLKVKILQMEKLGMGRVKTRPEIWPDPRPFRPTRPDPSQFFVNPSNPKKFFYQPENIFFHKCVQIQSKLTKKMRKNLTRAWPEHNFMNPNQNSLTRDPTRVRSHNPKPDPRAEKRTRPIPTIFLFIFVAWSFRLDMSGGS